MLSYLQKKTKIKENQYLITSGKVSNGSETLTHVASWIVFNVFKRCVYDRAHFWAALQSIAWFLNSVQTSLFLTICDWDWEGGANMALLCIFGISEAMIIKLPHSHDHMRHHAQFWYVIFKYWRHINFFGVCVFFAFFTINFMNTTIALNMTSKNDSNDVIMTL